MRKKVVYISDFLAEDILGGGELNDRELCSILSKEYDIDVTRMRATQVNTSVIQDKNIDFFIISNFIWLQEKGLLNLFKNRDYVIYEHDHKYLRTRNPGFYKNFQAPKGDIINEQFYKNAKKVFCQSSFHKDIIKRNLDINNIENVSGNLWSEKELQYMEDILSVGKKDVCSIMGDKGIFHKNSQDCIIYCTSKKIKYEVIKSQNYLEFLKLLGTNSKFIFLPKSPETLSRVVVEARMMGVSVMTNRMVGACHEPWFSQKGKELIDTMREKRKEIGYKINKVICHE